jgi:hypothetical protein
VENNIKALLISILIVTFVIFFRQEMIAFNWEKYNEKSVEKRQHTNQQLSKLEGFNDGLKAGSSLFFQSQISHNDHREIANLGIFP